MTSLLNALSAKKNLSVFRNLVEQNSEIFGSNNFPVGGVTILAFNNKAFKRAFPKVNDWRHLDPELRATTLQYHVISRPVLTSDLRLGESVILETCLVNPPFDKVTDGQRLIVTKTDRVVFTSGHATRGTVIVGNIMFSNGIIHVIDTVMKVPESLEATSQKVYKGLQSFVGGLYASGLMPQLASGRDLTIYAPSNEAIRVVSGYLHEAPLDKMKDIFQYHVTPGIVIPSWELKNGTEMPTMGTQSVCMTVACNNRFVNSARVILDNVLIANGIIHVVDAVLNPEKPSLRPDFTSAKQEPAFELTDPSVTSSEEEIPFASNIPTTSTSSLTSYDFCPPSPFTDVIGSGAKGNNEKKSDAIQHTSIVGFVTGGLVVAAGLLAAR